MTGKLTLHMSVYLICTFLQVHVHASSSDVQDLTSFGTISLKDCFDECKKRTSCVSLTYKRRATFCRLFNQPLVDYSHIRTAGLLYRDSSGWPELNQPTICKCKEDGICDGACAVLECPVPNTLNNMECLGNLRNIGSKVKYTCNTGDPASTIWTCARNGTWTGVNIVCNIYGYYQQNNLTVASNRKINFELQSVNLIDCLKRCNQTGPNCNFFNINPTLKRCWSPYYDGGLIRLSLPGWHSYFKKTN